MAARESFRAWLIDAKGFSGKLAADALSRCRRVERLLDIQLDAAVRTEDDIQVIITRLRRMNGAIDGASMPPAAGMSSLVRAVRLYAAFAATHPGAAAHEEARDADWTAFRRWLALEQHLAPATTTAIVSRCKRVERLTGMTLDARIRSEGGLDDALARVSEATGDECALRLDARAKKLAWELSGAVRHFHRYLKDAEASAQQPRPSRDASTDQVFMA